MLMSHVTPSFYPLQSAYMTLYSTEMALLKIINYICKAVDIRRTTTLVALNLSAAFDSIDHFILLSRLERSFGVIGQVLSWVRSYLTEWTSFVMVGNASSPITFCNTGVPQGSDLSPLLFSLFIKILGEVISAFSVKFHQYADDTRIYLTIDKENSL